MAGANILRAEGTLARAGADGPLSVLFLTAYPGISGPLPKLAPLMTEAMRDLGCLVVTTPWSHRRPHESLLEKAVMRAGDIRSVRRVLASRPFDVMLVTTTHDWPALLRDLPLLALTRSRCRTRVVHLHGSMVDRLVGPGNVLMKACSRLLLRQCDAILVLSEEERRNWLRFAPRARVEVVVNPFVAPPRMPGPAVTGAEPPALLFVGRLIPEKGVFDLLEAFRLVRRQRPCTLRIAGEGPCREALRARIVALGLEDCVDILGYVVGDELWDLYGSSAALVLPTFFGEGFPTVISEAMSAGLPIITTPVRGIADLLRERDNALFVPPRDPAALARAILELLGDRGLAVAMSDRNREKVLEFAPSAVVPKYVRIMRELAS